MPNKHPFKLRVLLGILKGEYGIVSIGKKGGGGSRGKGSEIILLKPNCPGSHRGPQYPMKGQHGKSDEISYQVVDAILRRFDINNQEFWDSH